MEEDNTTESYWPAEAGTEYNADNCTEVFNPAKDSDLISFYFKFCYRLPFPNCPSWTKIWFAAYFLQIPFFVFFIAVSPPWLREDILGLLLFFTFLLFIIKVAIRDHIKYSISDYNYIICEEGIKYSSGFLPFEKVSYILITKKYFYPVIDFRAADDRFGPGKSLFVIKTDWYYRREYISHLRQVSGKPIRFRDRSILGLKEWEKEDLAPYSVKRH